MLTFDQLYSAVLPSTQRPRSARAICKEFGSRGLSFRATVAAVGKQKCALTISMYSTDFLLQSDPAAHLTDVYSQPGTADIQTFNAQLGQYNLGLKLVSQDLRSAVLVGTWDDIAKLPATLITVGPISMGANSAVGVGTIALGLGGAIIAMGPEAVPAIIAGFVFLGIGAIFIVLGTKALDSESNAPSAPMAAPPATTKSNIDTPVDQDDGDGDGATDTANIPISVLFGIPSGSVNGDQLLAALDTVTGLPDTTGWGGSDSGGFLSGGDPNSGDNGQPPDSSGLWG